MTSHRVLITGIGGNIGQGVLKALRASRRPFHVVGIDMEPLSAGFSLVDRYYRTPRTSDPAFPAALAAIAREESLEAVYVCSPTELEFFARNRERLTREFGLTAFVNPPEVVGIGSDKLRTAEFLRDAGFPSPRTVRGTDAEGLATLVAQCGLPLVVKPRTGFSSRYVFVVRSRDELQAATTLVPDAVVQQYLPDHGGEYTAATLSGADARVRAMIVLRRDLLQGTTYRTELVEDAHVGRQIAGIVESLGAIGPCNVQFRIVDGTPYVFEINPRFSGTAGIRHLYGFNDAEMAFDLLRLGLDVQQPVLRRAVVLRYWNEICVPNATFDDLRQERVKHGGFEATISGPRYDP